MPPIVINSVGARLTDLFLDLCVLPNLLETILPRGRNVGRQAQMTPQALSTTHQVQEVASVTVEHVSKVGIMAWSRCFSGRAAYKLCRFGQNS